MNKNDSAGRQTIVFVFHDTSKATEAFNNRPLGLLLLLWVEHQSEGHLSCSKNSAIIFHELRVEMQLGMMLFHVSYKTEALLSSVATQSKNSSLFFLYHEAKVKVAAILFFVFSD